MAQKPDLPSRNPNRSRLTLSEDQELALNIPERNPFRETTGTSLSPAQERVRGVVAGPNYYKGDDFLSFGFTTGDGRYGTAPGSAAAGIAVTDMYHSPYFGNDSLFADYASDEKVERDRSQVPKDSVGRYANSMIRTPRSIDPINTYSPHRGVAAFSPHGALGLDGPDVNTYNVASSVGLPSRNPDRVSYSPGLPAPNPNRVGYSPDLPAPNPNRMVSAGINPASRLGGPQVRGYTARAPSASARVAQALMAPEARNPFGDAYDNPFAGQGSTAAAGGFVSGGGYGAAPANDPFGDGGWASEAFGGGDGGFGF